MSFKSITQRNLTVIGILALTAFCAYGLALTSGFKSMDDQVSILDNENIQSLANIDKVFASSFFTGNNYYRPAVALSFMLEYFFFGPNAFFFYLTNIFLHIAMAVSVFFLLQKFLPSRELSFYVAFLFVLHPVHWEAVTNVAGRSNILCALFFVNAFLCFYLSQNKPTQKYLWYAASLILFALSLLSKESAIMLPFVLLAYIYFVLGKDEPRKKLYWLAGYGAVTGIYLGIRFSLHITNVLFKRDLQEWFWHVFTFLRSLITDIRLLIFPYNLYYDRSQKVLIDFLNLDSALTVVFLIMGVVILMKIWRRLSGLERFLMAWFVLDMFPVSQVITPIIIAQGYISSADHFLYLPAVSFLTLLVLWAKRFYESEGRRKPISEAAFSLILGGIFIFLFLGSLQQAIYSQNEIAMFKRSLEFNPANTRVRTSLGLAYAKNKLFAEAADEFRSVLGAEPWNVRARIAFGKALCDQGKFNGCLNQYEQITDAGGLEDLLQDNIKLTHQILIVQYQNMIHQGPQTPQAYFSLGVIYFKDQQIEKAVEQFKKALKLDPQYQDAQFNLAVSLEILTDKGQAAIYYQEVITGQTKGELAYQSYLRLGEIFRELGEDEKAQGYFQAAEEMKKEH